MGEGAEGAEGDFSQRAQRGNSRAEAQSTQRGGRPRIPTTTTATTLQVVRRFCVLTAVAGVGEDAGHDGWRRFFRRAGFRGRGVPLFLAAGVSGGGGGARGDRAAPLRRGERGGRDGGDALPWPRGAVARALRAPHGRESPQRPRGEPVRPGAGLPPPGDVPRRAAGGARRGGSDARRGRPSTWCVPGRPAWCRRPPGSWRDSRRIFWCGGSGTA